MYDGETTHLPSGLDTMSPGPELGRLLCGIDVRSLSGYDRVTLLRAHQRMVSHCSAKVFEDMVSTKDVIENQEDLGSGTGDAASAEIRAALVLTRRTADNELGYAIDLVERLPEVFEALNDGIIDPMGAKTVVRGLEHLDNDVAGRVANTALESAAGLTTGQLAAHLRRLCIETAPDDAQAAIRTRLQTAE